MARPTGARPAWPFGIMNLEIPATEAALQQLGGA